MISEYTHVISCGITLLGGETLYQTAKAWMDDFARRNYQYSPTAKQVVGVGRYNYKCFIWSHSKGTHKIGVKLAEFIKEHGLGEVTESAPAGNPVHGDRPITVWVWSRDNTAFKKYAEELLLPKDKTDADCPEHK